MIAAIVAGTTAGTGHEINAGPTDIDRLISSTSALPLDFQSQAMFRETQIESKTGFGVRSYRAFEMTRDGFTLLAMGFTGKSALQFKTAYIAQFNATIANKPACGSEIGPTSATSAMPPILDRLKSPRREGWHRPSI
jgi:hypothetical protein